MGSLNSFLPPAGGFLVLCAAAACANSPFPTYAPAPVVPAPALLSDFESPARYGIGFEENLEPATGEGRVVDTTAHTGTRSLRVDFTLPSSGAGLFIQPIHVAPRQLPADPWGLEFWVKADAPHDIWVDVTLREGNGETWTLGHVMRTDDGIIDWHPVRMAFDWARLVTWNRVDGHLDLQALRSVRITFKALGGRGPQTGTLWVDSVRLLDAAHPVAWRSEGDFVLLGLEAVFNSDGVAWRSNPTDGDFHTGEWQQRTLPAEFFPKTPEASFHGVPFRMPPLADGVDNHIRCNGQKLVGFPIGTYSALYVLATGKFGDQIGDLELHYTDETTSHVALDISDWSQGAHRGDVPAITFPHTYYKKSIENRAPQIFLQSVRIDPTRRLASLRLPTNDYLKVFALTLDRAAQPVDVGALHARPVAEVDPRYFMPDSLDLDFSGPTKPVGVLGGYLARGNRRETLDIPTFNGFLTFASDALSLPRHTLVYDKFRNLPGQYSLGGLQVDGRRFGLVRVDCLSSVCGTYACDVITSNGTQEFTVYLSRAVPAALYDVESRGRFWHDPDRGGSTFVSFCGTNGLQTIQAGEGVEIPVPREPWLVVWHADEVGSRPFDVPVLLVLERKPARLHWQRSADEAAWDLHLPCSGQPGRVIAATPFGIRRIDIETTNAWDAYGIPDEVVDRCRKWAARLQRFPVDLHQEFILDDAAGRVAVNDRFDSLSLRSDWAFQPLDFTPLPPVAALASQNGYPVEFGPDTFDTGTDTFWGPLLGVNDTTTSYSIPVPVYTVSMLVPSAVKSDPVAEKVTDELRELIRDRIPSDLETARFVSDNCGDLSSLRIFAPSRLLIGDSDRVTSYCRAVVENALQTKNLKLEKEPLTGQFYLMDDRFWARDASYDKEWAIGFILQGLWNYAYYCDDPGFLRRHWSRIQGLYRYYRIVFDWTTSSTYTMATGGGANSDGVRIAWEGMLAMARMADMVGDTSVRRDAVVRASRQMMSLYASWFAVPWAVDHDYAIERNRHIPPAEAETRFAPDVSWVETYTANAAHTEDFFQVTHAFYIFNLGHLLYFHDLGIDDLRLRNWIYKVVPQLHPDWCDGNVLCRGSHRYYGSDHAMAHLIARALVFHEHIGNLYDCYRKSVDDTRVVTQWYSPMGVAPFALGAMLTGTGPLVVAPVRDVEILENTFDVKGRRQRVVLRPRVAQPASLWIRCWGNAPEAATCNGKPLFLHYDATTDYATVPLRAADNDPCVLEVRYP